MAISRISNRQNSPASAAGVWAFFVFALPALLVLSMRSHKYMVVEFLPLIVVLYAATRLGSLQLDGDPKLISICFWLFVYLFLGLIPLLQFLNGAAFPWYGQRYHLADITKAYLAIIAGLLAFDLGGWISKRRLPPQAAAEQPAPVRALSRRRLTWFTVSAIAITLIMIQKVGGLDTLLVARLDRAKMIGSIAGGEGQAMLEIWSALLRTPSAAAFLCLLAFSFQGRRLGASGKVLLGISLVFVLLISNPVSAARFWVGTIFFGTAFIMMRWNRSRSVALVSIGIATIFAVVFPFADAFRSSTDVQLNETIRSSAIADVLATKPDFDAFQQTLNSVEFVDAEGLSYGRQLVGTALFWVPRSTWQDKPENTGMMVAEEQGYAFKNLSLPLWAESYIDGGLVMVILIFALYGAFVASIEEHYMKLRTTGVPTFTGIFVPVFAPYQFYLLRGSLMPAMAGLLPLVFCLFITTAKLRHSRTTLAGAA